MRISFFPVDSSNRNKKINKVSKIGTDLDNTTSLNKFNGDLDTKVDNLKQITLKDYRDINSKLYDNEGNAENNDNKKKLLSEEELLDLKKSISDGSYKINIKALSLGLLRYIERD